MQQITSYFIQSHHYIYSLFYHLLYFPISNSTSLSTYTHPPMQTNTEQIQHVVKSCYNQKESKLSFNQLGRVAWKEVIEYIEWQLKKLEIFNLQLKVPDIVYIVSFKWCKNLTQLKLYSNFIASEGLQELLKIQWPELTRFYLSINRIENTGLQILLQKHYQMPKLQSLQLQQTNITYTGLFSAPNSALFQHLKYLNLSRNVIGSRGTKLLNKIQYSTLKELWLDFCEIKDDGVKHLAKSKWPKLRILRLSVNYIGCDGYYALNNYQLLKLDQLVIWDVKAIALLSATAAQLPYKLAISHQFDKIKLTSLFVNALTSRFGRK